MEELMQSKTQETPQRSDVAQIMNTACKGVALAMGVAVVVLLLLNELTVSNGMGMLGIGLACSALAQFDNRK